MFSLGEKIVAASLCMRPVMAVFLHFLSRLQGYSVHLQISFSCFFQLKQKVQPHVFNATWSSSPATASITWLVLQLQPCSCSVCWSPRCPPSSSTDLISFVSLLGEAFLPNGTPGVFSIPGQQHAGSAARRVSSTPGQQRAFSHCEASPVAVSEAKAFWSNRMQSFSDGFSFASSSKQGGVGSSKGTRGPSSTCPHLQAEVFFPSGPAGTPGQQQQVPFS